MATAIVSNATSILVGSIILMVLIRRAGVSPGAGLGLGLGAGGIGGAVFGWLEVETPIALLTNGVSMWLAVTLHHLGGTIFGNGSAMSYPGPWFLNVPQVYPLASSIVWGCVGGVAGWFGTTR